MGPMPVVHGERITFLALRLRAAWSRGVWCKSIWRAGRKLSFSDGSCIGCAACLPFCI